MLKFRSADQSVLYLYFLYFTTVCAPRLLWCCFRDACQLGFLFWRIVCPLAAGQSVIPINIFGTLTSGSRQFTVFVSLYFHNVLPFISFWWIWTKVQNITVMCKLFYDLVPYHRSSQQLYVVKSIKVKYLNVRFQIWTGWITNTWERSKWENNIYLLQSFKKYFKK